MPKLEAAICKDLVPVWRCALRTSLPLQYHYCCTGYGGNIMASPLLQAPELVHGWSLGLCRGLEPSPRLICKKSVLNELFAFHIECTQIASPGLLEESHRHAESQCMLTLRRGCSFSCFHCCSPELTSNCATMSDTFATISSRPSKLSYGVVKNGPQGQNSLTRAEGPGMRVWI